MPACAMVPTGVIYWLKNALYVGLTNRTRGLSLVASRGPGFAMPAASGFAPLAAEPSVDDVVAAIYDAYDHDERKKALGQDVGRTQRADGGATDPGVVFAGLGDPLLRWRDVAAIAERVYARHPVPLRLNTNGLLPPGDDPADVAAALRAARVSHATVALNAADPAAYEALMLAPPPWAPAYHAAAADAVGDVAGASFGDACGFVAALAEADVEVTVSCVAAPVTADVAAVRQLALALGAVGVKERPFLE